MIETNCGAVQYCLRCRPCRAIIVQRPTGQPCSIFGIAHKNPLNLNSVVYQVIRSLSLVVILPRGHKSFVVVGSLREALLTSTWKSQYIANMGMHNTRAIPGPIIL